jgi:hypothetical protein
MSLSFLSVFGLFSLQCLRYIYVCVCGLGWGGWGWCVHMYVSLLFHNAFLWLSHSELQLEHESIFYVVHNHSQVPISGHHWQ